MTDQDHAERRHDTTPDPAETLERVLEHVPPAERHRAREALEALTARADRTMDWCDAFNDLSIELLAARRERDELREAFKAEQARRLDAEARLESAEEGSDQ